MIRNIFLLLLLPYSANGVDLSKPSMTSKTGLSSELGQKACAETKGPQQSAKYEGSEPLVIQFLEKIVPKSITLASVVCGTARFDERHLNVAVAPQGDIFYLPKDLSKLFKAVNFEVSDKSSAVEIAITFLILDGKRDQPISSTKDIHGYGEKPPMGEPNKLTRDQERSIVPPKALSHDGFFDVQLFTWNANSGDVSKKSFKIPKAGAIEIQDSRLAKEIGITQNPM